MIIGIGCDIIEIARVQKAVQRQAFQNRVFSADEIAYCTRQTAAVILHHARCGFSF